MVPERDGRGSHGDVGSVRGSMVAMALGRLTTTTREGCSPAGSRSWRPSRRLPMPATSLRARETKRDDLLYLWSSAIARVDPVRHGRGDRVRHCTPARALDTGIAGAVILVEGARSRSCGPGCRLHDRVLPEPLHSRPGDEQGLVPDGWDSGRAAPFVANFIVVALIALAYVRSVRGSRELRLRGSQLPGRRRAGFRSNEVLRPSRRSLSWLPTDRQARALVRSGTVFISRRPHQRSMGSRRHRWPARGPSPCPRTFVVSAGDT